MSSDDLILNEVRALNEALHAIKQEVAELRGGLTVRCATHTDDIAANRENIGRLVKEVHKVEHDNQRHEQLFKMANERATEHRLRLEKVEEKLSGLDKRVAIYIALATAAVFVIDRLVKFVPGLN